MKHRRNVSRASIISVLSSFGLLAGLLGSCKMTEYYNPPVVTAQMALTRDGDLMTLQKGRTLFAHRCIECHTLPPLWHYQKEDWPEIVNSMSHRASLNLAERDAIILYILTVRAQH
jgi:hypothetical protein